MYLYSMKRSGIKVFAPASISNVAVGFDILGIALEYPGDEVIVSKHDGKGLILSSIHGDGGVLSRDPMKNAASVSAMALLDHLGASDMGIQMELFKKMPFASGMGSSAASAVAGVMAINELLGKPLSKRELLPFAMAGEHAVTGNWYTDNVVASMMGGIMLIRDNRMLDIHRLPVPRGLFVTVCHPHIQLITQEVRSILKKEVELDHVIQQTGNLAAFVHSLYQADFGLMRRALKDILIEPQRAPLIPGFYDIQEAAMEAGALGCSISGSGPAIFALSDNSFIAEEAGEQMKRASISKGLECTIYLSQVNQEGSLKC